MYCRNYMAARSGTALVLDLAATDPLCGGGYVERKVEKDLPTDSLVCPPSSLHVAFTQVLAGKRESTPRFWREELISGGRPRETLSETVCRPAWKGICIQPGGVQCPVRIG